MRSKKSQFFDSVNLDTHFTKIALKDLLPHAIVGGGSFVNELSSPEEISNTEARSQLESARQQATEVTIDEILQSLDTEHEFSVEKQSQAYRSWPSGYTGSLTDKGAIVLAAVSPKNHTTSLGIDVEYDRNGGEGLSHVVNDGEIPEGREDESAILGVFSTKESVYKAWYPFTSEKLGFNDINITWVKSVQNIDYGVANFSDSVEVEVQCLYKENWIVSTAVLMNNG